MEELTKIGLHQDQFDKIVIGLILLNAFPNEKLEEKTSRSGVSIFHRISKGSDVTNSHQICGHVRLEPVMHGA